MGQKQLTKGVWTQKRTHKNCSEMQQHSAHLHLAICSAKILEPAVMHFDFNVNLYQICI